jgi:hypothetical protein
MVYNQVWAWGEFYAVRFESATCRLASGDFPHTLVQCTSDGNPKFYHPLLWCRVSHIVGGILWVPEPHVYQLLYLHERIVKHQQQRCVPPLPLIMAHDLECLAQASYVANTLLLPVCQGQPYGAPRAVAQQGQPSLIRSKELGARALCHLVEFRMWVLALVAVRALRSGNVRAAKVQRRCQIMAGCWSAAGVSRCDTVGGHARRRTGRLTKPHASACNPHEGETVASESIQWWHLGALFPLRNGCSYIWA